MLAGSDTEAADTGAAPSQLFPLCMALCIEAAVPSTRFATKFDVLRLDALPDSADPPDVFSLTVASPLVAF